MLNVERFEIAGRVTFRTFKVILSSLCDPVNVTFRRTDGPNLPPFPRRVSVKPEMDMGWVGLGLDFSWLGHTSHTLTDLRSRTNLSAYKVESIELVR